MLSIEIMKEHKLQRINYTKLFLESNNNINFIDNKYVWDKEQ